MEDPTPPVATACVQCVRCGTEFPAMAGMEDTRQALGCASYIMDGKVVGAYGSRVLDMEEAVFASGAGQDLSQGEICDKCIEHLLSTGELAVHASPHLDPPEAPKSRRRMPFLSLPCFSVSQYGGVAMEYALIAAMVSITIIPGLLSVGVGDLFDATQSLVDAAVSTSLSGEGAGVGDAAGGSGG